MAKSTNPDKQVQLKVDKGIPLPPTQKRGGEVTKRINWPFTQMNAGDSFLIPDWCDTDRPQKALAALKRRGDMAKSASIAIRTEGDSHRIWLTSE